MYKKLKFYLNQATCVSPVPCQQTAIFPLCFVIVVHHVYTWGWSEIDVMSLNLDSSIDFELTLHKSGLSIITSKEKKKQNMNMQEINKNEARHIARQVLFKNE